MNENQQKYDIYLDNLYKSFKSIKWYEWVMITIMVAVAGNSVVYGFIEPTHSHNPPWLNIINFISAVCGIICIFFTARASISACIFGLINTVVYIIYLWYWHIYGTLCLELFVYLPVAIGQWYIWSNNRDRSQPEITMAKKLTVIQRIWAIVGIILCGMVYYIILVSVGGSVPLLDAFTVSIGVIAITLCMLRYREQYILWLITDVIAVTMYIVMFDPVYLTKKTIYLIMAVIGLYNWYTLNRTRNALNI